jgi:hypothetical protein
MSTYILFSFEAVRPLVFFFYWTTDTTSNDSHGLWDIKGLYSLTIYFKFAGYQTEKKGTSVWIPLLLPLGYIYSFCMISKSIKYILKCTTNNNKAYFFFYNKTMYWDERSFPIDHSVVSCGTLNSFGTLLGWLQGFYGTRSLSLFSW